MGRESICHCTSVETAVEAKALLESSELILRGGIRRRIPFTLMRDVRGIACELSFSVAGVPMSLHFPRAIAASWAERIAAPPVSLAQKLGIREGSALLFQGEPSSVELKAALAIGKITSWSDCQIAIAEVTNKHELVDLMLKAGTHLPSGSPLWIIYRKGANQPLTETLERSTTRELGWRDNKVASVSSEWTGLRFARTALSR
jgi:hypothetical protein